MQNVAANSTTLKNDVFTFSNPTSGAQVEDITDIGSLPAFINDVVKRGREKGSFLVTDLVPVISQYQQWVHELPMVQPFYAVKCLPDPVILCLLASLGCGFDCASRGEIEMITTKLGEKLNFDKEKAMRHIIYANPAKMPEHVEYALKSNVRMATFDGEDELYKYAEMQGHENLQLLLRLTTDDETAVCAFSRKFGCPVAEAPDLLEIAKSLNLTIVGVSFHVGSGCRNAAAYNKALRDAQCVFEAAEDLGMPALSVVDIGGGFPGDAGGFHGPDMPTFQDLCAVIRLSIEEFAQNMNRPLDSLRFIAEPGRYFVSASTTIVTKVYARKGGKKKQQVLYVDDGVYGSFNNVVYDHAAPIPVKLTSALQRVSSFKSRGAANTGMSSTFEDLKSIRDLEEVLSEIELDVTSRSRASSYCIYPLMQEQQNTDSSSYAYDSDAPGAAAGQASTPLSAICETTDTSGSATPKIDDHVEEVELIPTAIFGPTCDGLDQMRSLEKTLMPRVEIGEWLMWENMGAYTHTASFVFNGYTHVPNRIYCYHDAWYVEDVRRTVRSVSDAVPMLTLSTS